MRTEHDDATAMMKFRHNNVIYTIIELTFCIMIQLIANFCTGNEHFNLAHHHSITTRTPLELSKKLSLFEFVIVELQDSCLLELLSTSTTQMVLICFGVYKKEGAVDA